MVGNGLNSEGGWEGQDRPYSFFLYGELRAIVFMYSFLPRTNLFIIPDYSRLTNEETEALKDCSNAQSHPEGISKVRFSYNSYKHTLCNDKMNAFSGKCNGIALWIHPSNIFKYLIFPMIPFLPCQSLPLCGINSFSETSFNIIYLTRKL